MKILLINKYHHQVGGAEKYYFDLGALLEQRGHTVAFFSMDNPKNMSGLWNSYFIPNINFRSGRLFQQPGLFLHMIYSINARDRLRRLINAFRPDVAHIHNIYYHLSPSILYELKKQNIPIIYTVHDYHLVTPNVTFFHNGSPCNISLKTNILQCIPHRCVDSSLSASLATSLTLWIHNYLQSYKNNIDIYLAPSKFMKDTLITNGYPAKKILHLSHFLLDSWRSPPDRSPTNPYAFFAGGASEKKGIHVILSAAELLPKMQFYIAGKGTDSIQLNKRYKHLSNVRSFGFVSSARLHALMQGASMVIVPSLWFENPSYVILEAMALGKPVIASAIGAIPEIIHHKKTGLLFNAGHVEELVKLIQYLIRNNLARISIGKRARIESIKTTGEDKHYRSLINIYSHVIQSNGALSI